VLVLVLVLVAVADVDAEAEMTADAVAEVVNDEADVAEAEGDDAGSGLHVGKPLTQPHVPSRSLRT
jgi:hypothetical protein